MQNKKTENQLIREAWQVQNACNLSGVIYSFARAMERLCEISHELKQGTEWRNSHIVSKLYASKIQSLTGDLPLDLPNACFNDETN